MRFLLILNPWGKVRWTGRFSVDDEKNWTKEMKEKLSFDSFKDNDNGVFWILYEDALKVFNSLELNWNPEILKYSNT
jgi:calpain-7